MYEVSTEIDQKPSQAHQHCKKKTEGLTMDQYNLVSPRFNNNIIWNMGPNVFWQMR